MLQRMRFLLPARQFCTRFDADPQFIRVWPPKQGQPESAAFSPDAGHPEVVPFTLETLVAVGPCLSSALFRDGYDCLSLRFACSDILRLADREHILTQRQKHEFISYHELWQHAALYFASHQQLLFDGGCITHITSELDSPFMITILKKHGEVMLVSEKVQSSLTELNFGSMMQNAILENS